MVLTPCSSYFFRLSQDWYLCSFLHFPWFFEKAKIQQLAKKFFKVLFFAFFSSIFVSFIVWLYFQIYPIFAMLIRNLVLVLKFLCVQRIPCWVSKYKQVFSTFHFSFFLVKMVNLCDFRVIASVIQHQFKEVTWPKAVFLKILT